MFVEMKVASLTIDPFTNLPTLRLTDSRGRSLPIGIGQNEAPAIAAQLAEVRLDRPMTHDLMKTPSSVFARSRSRKVEILTLPGGRGGALCARLYLRQPDGVRRSVDSRPSDAIALALRARAPIFVEAELCNLATADELRQASAPSRSLFGMPRAPQSPPVSKWKM